MLVHYLKRSWSQRPANSTASFAVIAARRFCRIDAATAARVRREGAARAAHRIALEVAVLREAGIPSQVGLTRALREPGVPAPRGGAEWTHPTVPRVLGSGGGVKGALSRTRGSELAQGTRPTARQPRRPTLSQTIGGPTERHAHARRHINCSHPLHRADVRGRSAKISFGISWNCPDGTVTSAGQGRNTIHSVLKFRGVLMVFSMEASHRTDGVVDMPWKSRQLNIRVSHYLSLTTEEGRTGRRAGPYRGCPTLLGLSGS